MKAPRAGRVKTRLAKDIGDERALAVYRKLVENTLEAVGGSSAACDSIIKEETDSGNAPGDKASGYDVALFLNPLLEAKGGKTSFETTFKETTSEISRWLSIDPQKIYLQQGETLGDKMAHALEKMLQTYDKALIIGTDIVGLSQELMQSAFDALETSDVVSGPALDGGYYLVGLKKPCPALFEGIAWSTSEVLQQTLDKIKKEGLTCALLEKKRDIDTLEDLQLEGLLQELYENVTCKAAIHRGLTREIYVIIPAFNEEESLPYVLDDLKKYGKGLLTEVIVVDNGSTDLTAQKSREHGATVIAENRQGYGWACLAAIDYIQKSAANDTVIVFMDGDYSDYPEELSEVVKPILHRDAEMVIGSRVERAERGALSFPQRFGNRLSTSLLNLFLKTRYTDLGPFRAITLAAFNRLQMRDKKYGWTIEMQMKAAVLGIKSIEIPVSYRKRRAGKSKVSGTLKGVVLAGSYILFYALLSFVWAVKYRRE